MAPGERSEEVHLWYTAVYEAVQEIPHGRVTSYGHIARLLGKREHIAYPQHGNTLLIRWNILQLNVQGTRCCDRDLGED
jgi:hypothetical protein